MNEIIRRCLVIACVITITMTFAGSAVAGFLDFKHTAAVMIGESRRKALAQAEHLLGTPKDVVYYFQGASDEVEGRRYSFTTEYDLILFFGKNVFLGVDSLKPGSNTYPKLMHAFQSFGNNPRLIGYIVSKKSKRLSLEVLSR